MPQLKATNQAIPAAARPAEIEAGQLSKVPKQTKFVKAEYPQAAEEQGIQAEVVLLLDITAEGKVATVGIAEPAQPTGLGFDEAAMAAAQQFEFEPAELDGKPVAVQLTYRYKFTVTPKAKSPQREAPAVPPPVAARTNPSATGKAAARTPRGVSNFRGLLREGGTRLPLPGILVTVFRDAGPEPVGFEATTDADGAFQFFDLPPGTWRVLVEAPGYYPLRTSETIAEGEALDAAYYLERGTYNPFDVTVTARRPKKEVSRTVLSSDEIEKIPGAVGDPLAVVQNFPGVARVDHPGVLVVRGSAPEDTLVVIEGTFVPLIYHFGGLGLEGQWEFARNLALRGGVGFGVVGLLDEENPDEERRGSFGGDYSLALAYDLFVSESKPSGGVAITPVVTLRYLPDDRVDTVLALFGVEVLWWLGLPSNELELPPGEGYDLD